MTNAELLDLLREVRDWLEVEDGLIDRIDAARRLA
jgi:hypothetical protein